jgi:hypothetical protein
MDRAREGVPPRSLEDNVIGVEWGRRARALLDDAGAEVLYRETPMFHQIDPDFVHDVSDLLRAV